MRIARNETERGMELHTQKEVMKKKNLKQRNNENVQCERKKYLNSPHCFLSSALSLSSSHMCM